MIETKFPNYEQTSIPLIESLTFSEVVGNNFGDFLEAMRRHSPKNGSYIANQIMKDARRLYKDKEVPKKNSKETRTCKAPCFLLKQLQKSLRREIEKLSTLDEAVHGFCKKRSNVTAAKTVKESLKNDNYTIINQDLKDAFPTISGKRVRSILRGLGFNTWQVHIAAKITCYEQELATGSPASPFIFNLALKKLDEKLRKVTEKYAGVFVRYADDLSLAINSQKRKVIANVKAKMNKIIKEEQFVAHKQKRKVWKLGKTSPKAETVGISLSSQEMKAPQRLRKRAFHVAKALGLKTTSSDPDLLFKLRREGLKAEKENPAKWKALGYFAYFLSIREPKETKPHGWSDKDIKARNDAALSLFDAGLKRYELTITNDEWCMKINA